MTDADDRLLDVTQAAALLAVPVSWVYAHAESGQLPRYRIGKYLRFRRAELLAWLAEQRVEETGSP